MDLSFPMEPTHAPDAVIWLPVSPMCCWLGTLRLWPVTGWTRTSRRMTPMWLHRCVPCLVKLSGVLYAW